ncbi:MAG: MFS transporter, partial [Clostridiales bacterium]|nr:MFS transporter [Clostridiales bacterium]
ITAALAPIAGAIADYKGYKKKLFVCFFALGLAFTALCAISDNWRVLFAGYIFSHVGFAGSCVLYDSFLPDVTVPERMDRLSGWGYAIGYIGGSTIPFLISIALIQFGDNWGMNTAGAVKASIWLTVIWWGGFTVPFLKNVRQNSYIEKPESGFLSHAFSNIFETARKIIRNKGLLLFIIAYFFYIDGVGTIISLATSYGTQLGLGMLGMILALLVTQIVAFPCSIIFSKLSKKVGALNMITAAVALYAVICVIGFFMGFLIEAAEIPAKLAALASQGVNLQNPGNLNIINAALRDASVPDSVWNAQPAYLNAISHSTVLFWILATLVGTVQGGIQALSRSYYGKIIPPENSGEYFGFFEIFGKFAAILGPLLYAFTKALLGRSSFSILSIIFLFGAALVFLTVGRRHMRQ